ncbi:envelope-like protein [Cucumis melo var. makuwa]|uniref:Envelope-like protein n=1 Tax=Cucumis melo var. makuwa TaxID=1194695 RepID=A0A5D3E4Y2_CUCMM|nr:envelope-like protein [Cucumis melo var. makuwa]TYK30994.1 envelope-like protein [Cucumis melo var. makuwa]
MSEMDSDEQDDVPLTRLLKKSLFFIAKPTVANAYVTSVHSDDSSSSEDIFVPTPGQPPTTNEDLGHSSHSPPVKSPVQTSSPVDVQQFVSDPNPMGQSTNNMGENIADNVDENPDVNVDDHDELIDNTVSDDHMMFIFDFLLHEFIEMK